ncbi:MAG TPA: hypothetical protein VFU06_07345 [Longimicrobiales bacterium]|nr:hypothetical protein [Longimicrobiales bacterium]
MSHLNAETLARLVDERPDALEAAHLDGCPACRAELDALRADVRALGGLGGIEPPARAWDELHERLVDEGLVRDTGRRIPAWMQIAAALALFLTGTAAGFTWRNATLPAQTVVAAGDSTAATRDAAPAAARTPEMLEPSADAAPRLASNDAPASGASDDVPAPASTRDDVRGSGSDAAGTEPRNPSGTDRSGSLASDVRGGDRPTQAPRSETRADDVAPRGEPRITGPLRADPRFAMQPYGARNAQEAATMLRDAESMYLDALAQYAQLSGELREIDDPVARLVVLESIVLTTREALDRAPADPIINGYHMTAVAQRDATLRQLATRSRQPQY